MLTSWIRIETITASGMTSVYQREQAGVSATTALHNRVARLRTGRVKHRVDGRRVTVPPHGPITYMQKLTYADTEAGLDDKQTEIPELYLHVKPATPKDAA